MMCEDYDHEKEKILKKINISAEKFKLIR